jgi:hypothetical protein
VKAIVSDGIEITGIELTRRNLTALLAKLDDPASARMLSDGETGFVVRAVEDNEHYSDRAPGEVYMPSTGESY